MISGLAMRLKTSRTKAGLNRKEAAELIGITESAIGQYETGSKQPALYTLMRLASVYDVSTDYLLGCTIKEDNIISLDGLSNEQKDAVEMIIKCFRENK